MSSSTTQGSRGRSRQRGGRSRNRRDSGQERSFTGPRPQPQQKKKTLWQKIAAIFGVGSSTSPAKSAEQETPSRRPEGRPDRPAQAERPKRSESSGTGFRKPEIIEVTSPRLYVGNLSFDATESDLSDLFNGVGLVQNVEIVSNKATQRSKGFGFIQMQTVDEAKRAVAELHDKEYMGRKLVVSGAKAADDRRSDRSIQPEQ